MTNWMHVLNWFWQSLKSQHKGPDGSPLREIVCFCLLIWTGWEQWPGPCWCCVVHTNTVFVAAFIIQQVTSFIIGIGFFRLAILHGLLILGISPWVTHLYQASWTQHWEPNSAVVLSRIQGLFGGKLLGFIFVHNMDSIKFRIKTLVLYSVDRKTDYCFSDL